MIPMLLHGACSPFLLKNFLEMDMIQYVTAWSLDDIWQEEEGYDVSAELVVDITTVL